MRGSLAGLVLCVSCLGAAPPTVELNKNPTEAPRGKLLIVGGGRIDDNLRRELVRRGGSRMVIVPFASDIGASDSTVDRIWLRAGAKDVYRISAKNVAEARRRLTQADFIWAPGGKQTLLARRLRDLKLADLIQQRYRAGATFGGTSAGASVVSQHMIRTYLGKTDLLQGLGLWPEVIVDQHFLKRNREGRLSAMLKGHPELLGVGLDESTAIEVKGRSFEVFGSSKVVVLDGRKSTAPPAPKSLTLLKHILSAGGKFDLDRGVLTE